MTDQDPQDPQEGKSIREMAENDTEDHEPELFPLGSLEGDDLTLRQIIKANDATEITVSMMSAEVPVTGGGLLDPKKEGMLLVTFEPSKNILVPVREGDRGEKRVVKWKVRQVVRPVYIEAANGEEGVIEAGFAALLEADASRAGALLDRMTARAGRALSSVG